MKPLPLFLSVIALATLGACRSPALAPAPGHFLTGSVTCRQRIALPADAMLEVQLLDITRIDTPAEVLNTVTISPVGQAPVYFKLSYDPAQIRPNHSYALQGRITVGGKLRFINTNAAHVLTYGYPTDRTLVLDTALNR